MKLSTKFDYSSVAYNVDNTVHLLIQATAPKIELDKARVPLNLHATLDVSPSMGGSKIEYARKSLMKLIDHLSPEDTLSLVTFDSDARTLFVPTKMNQKAKDEFKQAVLKTTTNGGGTNISGAMLEAIRHANTIDGASRVILFTDGQPNVGASVQALPDVLRQNMRKNLSLTSFGYGSDHDAKLLTALAEIGKGNYAYLENPDDALTAFARELGGLLSCHAQNLKFTVTPKEKTEILSVMSDVDVEEIPEGGVQISVPDLYSEETRNIVLQLKLDRQPKAYPRETSVADIVLKYDRLPEGKRQSVDTRAKVQFVKLEDVQKTADIEVVDQVALCQIMKAQEQATVYATAGNYAMANSVMTAAAANIGVQGVQGATGCQGSTGVSGATGLMGVASSYFVSQDSFTNSSFLRAANAHSHSTGRSSHASNSGLYASNSVMDTLVEAFKADDQQHGLLSGHTHGAGGATSSHSHSLTMDPNGSVTLTQLGGGIVGVTAGAIGSVGSSGTLSGDASSVAAGVPVVPASETKTSKAKTRSKKEW